jgi:uncharacterized short protein YbdD (DUF466 family)
MRVLRSLAQLVWRLLRELSDETAYQRHLSLHHAQSSPEEWRHFSEERLRSKYTRPRCC